MVSPSLKYIILHHHQLQHDVDFSTSFAAMWLLPRGCFRIVSSATAQLEQELRNVFILLQQGMVNQIEIIK